MPARPRGARLRWAREDEAAQALELALGAEWPQRPLEERAVTLERAAELAAERRRRLAAMIVREAGKPWEDADAEVCEAIDFLRFYARTARTSGRRALRCPASATSCGCDRAARRP